MKIKRAIRAGLGRTLLVAGLLLPHFVPIGLANLVVNGNFETGNLEGWTPDAMHNISTQGSTVVADHVYNGNYSYYMHMNAQANTLKTIHQNVDLTGVTDPVLTFAWDLVLEVGSAPFGGARGSYAGVDLYTPDRGSKLATLTSFGGNELSTQYSTGGWVEHEFALRDYTTEDQISLVFWMQSRNDQGRRREMWVDDVVITGEPGWALYDDFTASGIDGDKWQVLNRYGGQSYVDSDQLKVYGHTGGWTGEGRVRASQPGMGWRFDITAAFQNGGPGCQGWRIYGYDPDGDQAFVLASNLSSASCDAHYSDGIGVYEVVLHKDSGEILVSRDGTFLRAIEASGIDRFAIDFSANNVWGSGNHSHLHIDQVEYLTQEVVQPVYTLTYAAGPGGSIHGATEQTVEHGADGLSVTAVADVGYHFVTWDDRVDTATRQDTGVTADISFTAEFAANVLTVDPESRLHGAGGVTSQSIEVSANIAWEAVSDSDWLDIVSDTMGSGNGEIIYDVMANSGSERVGAIILSGGGLEQTFVVTQEGVTESPSNGVPVQYGQPLPLALADPGITPHPVGGNLYVTGGFVGTEPYSDRIFRYDVDADQWSELDTRLPYGMRVHSTGVASADPDAFYMGPSRGPMGYNGWGQHRDVLRMDVATETITAVGSFPYNLWDSGVAASRDGRIYLFGGHNGSDQSHIYRYDPDADTFAALSASLPVVTAHLRAYTAMDGRIFLLGARHGATDGSRRVIIFDPDSETILFYEENILPVSGRRISSPWQWGEYLYFIAMDDGTLYKLHIDDMIVEESERQLFDAPTHYRPVVAIDEATQRVYLVGGIEDGSYVDHVRILDRYAFQEGDGPQVLFFEDFETGEYAHSLNRWNHASTSWEASVRDGGVPPEGKYLYTATDITRQT